jgi:restriction system protein
MLEEPPGFEAHSEVYVGETSMQQVNVYSHNLNSIVVGELQVKYNARGDRVLRYYIDFKHRKLGVHKELSATELSILQGKIDALMQSWDRKVADHRRKAALLTEKETADQMTIMAAAKLEALSKLLEQTLKVDDRIDWDTLKDKSRFSEGQDFGEAKPVRSSVKKPLYRDPKVSFLDRLTFRKSKRIREAREAYERATWLWQDQERASEKDHARDLAAWERRLDKFKKESTDKERAFLTHQQERNAHVDALADGVTRGEAESVIEHVGMVLERSDYGDLFQKSFEVDYVPGEKTVLIEYALPSPDDMPTLQSVRFNASTGELMERHISEREQKSNYDSVCYQICLRTIHEVLEADEYGNIEKILFNGFAEFVERSTGQDTRSCIMSLLVSRSDFEEVDLSRIDPRACFKRFKGVSASSLAALAPVPPVMNLNKDDRRFIDAKSTVGDLSEATNLASMDWGDFEHLVREVFEKEFSSRGGVVKITQASGDGGVDAVAFDPDPITGGKIVIQAKRYTKTVGVNAVRDLYGTMQHEGASKGILITTADYGPDAYRFAAGKPIALLTGSNLLHLLEKHGHRAKIDLSEARKELNLRERR